MASIDDVFNQISQTNTNLQAINTTLTGISQQIGLMLAQFIYSNQALFHLSKQDDTIICELGKIAQQTCDLLNEAHAQTGIQHSIDNAASTMTELYKTTHPDAALEEARREDLEKKIEQCCPTPEAVAPCSYEPCPTTASLGAPPSSAPETPKKTHHG